MTQRQPPYASERVIYRTHSEILTDRQIIVNGNLYRLRDIASVGVTRTRYFFPLQIARLLLAIVAVIALLGVLGIEIDWLPDRAIVRLLMALATGGLAFVLPDLIPMHAIQLRTASAQALIMHVSDAHYLRMVVDHIQDAIANLPDDDRARV